jgi:hypothetical protein
MLALAMLAGAVRALTPDHWLPGSILVWQRGWRAGRSFAFAFAAFAAHVALGAALYFVFSPVLARLEPAYLMPFSAVFVGASLLVRLLRFWRIREVHRAGPEGIWGVLVVLSLLGPCEALVPIFMKSRLLGMGYALPFAAYLVGTALTGTVAILVGRALWDRPLALPRELFLAYRGSTFFLAIAGLALGLGAILRIS